MKLIVMVLLVAGALMSSPGMSQETSALTQYERLLDADKLVERSMPANVTWSDDSRYVSFEEIGPSGKRAVRVDAATGKRVRTPKPVADGGLLRQPKAIGSSYPQSAVAGSTLYELPSPGGRWLLGREGFNLYVRDADAGRIDRLTTDGEKYRDWNVGRGVWHVSESLLAVSRTDNRAVARIPRVRWLQQPAQVELEAFPLIDGPFPTEEIHVFDLKTHQAKRMELPSNEYLSILGFRPDTTEVLVSSQSRGQQRRGVYACDAASGRCRSVFEESTSTFFLDAPGNGSFVALSRRRGFIATSDRSGVENLYLLSAEGEVIRPLTQMQLPVTGIIHVDEAREAVYFMAASASERPYDQHLWRISFAGGKAERLTSEEGQHVIRMAPSDERFLDYHSSITRPPTLTLRDRGGKRIATIAASSLDAKTFWNGQLPEPFVVKAADGKTDLHGVLYKPFDFDPRRKYPVIQFVYGGPQTTITQRHFGPGQLSLRGEIGSAPGLAVISGYLNTAPALAQLGFITFTVDARGTPGRSKQFQDAAYRDIGPHTVQDYVATLDQLFASRSYMDGNRVGIYGRSFGGFHTVRAMLAAADRYRVGVASAPALGGPLSSIAFEGYFGDGDTDPSRYSSMDNTLLAGNLQGKLLLIYGTNDVDIPFNQAMSMVEAFVRAGKYVDMLVLPEQNHLFMREGDPSWMDHRDEYRNTAIRNYFVCHLLAADAAPAKDFCNPSPPEKSK